MTASAKSTIRVGSPRIGRQGTSGPIRFLSLLAIFLMVASACESSEVERSASEASDSLEISEPELPEDFGVNLIIRYMGVDRSPRSIEREIAEYAELHHQRETNIGECMSELGFDYAEEPLGEPYGPYFSSEHGQVGTREWHQHYGFGESTLLLPEQVLPEDVAGVPTEGLEALPPDEFEPPALGSDAYLRALYGDDDAEGCIARESNQLVNEFGLAVKTWANELAEVEALVLASKPVVSYEAGLIECVGEKGYRDFGGAAEYVDGIRAQLDDLVGSSFQMLIPGEDILDSLRLIQQEERGVAVALFDCRLPQDEEIALYRNAVQAVLDEHR